MQIQPLFPTISFNAANALAGLHFLILGRVPISSPHQEPPDRVQVDVDTGEVRRSVALPRELFGEGTARFGDKLLQLTWRRGTVLEYASVGTFHTADTVNFTVGATSRDTGLRDGWGITHDGEFAVVTDSSPTMRWLHPETLRVEREAVVYDGEAAVPWVNELEWIDGEVRPCACFLLLLSYTKRI